MNTRHARYSDPTWFLFLFHIFWVGIQQALQARLAQLVACQLVVPEFQVQTRPGANSYEQIILRVYCIVVHVMYYNFIEKFSPLPGFEPGTSPVPSRYATNWAILAWITVNLNRFNLEIATHGITFINKSIILNNVVLSF